MLQFKNPDVAAKYASPFKGNPIVHKPGGKNGNGFKLRLADISLEQADRIFAGAGQNLLQLKATAEKSETKPAKGQEKKEQPVP